MSRASTPSSVFLVLGDQLFPMAKTPFKKGDQVVMIEDYGLGTHFQYHKNKLLFFLISMREYAKMLREKGVKLNYYSADHKLFKKSFTEKLRDVVDQNPKLEELHIYEINDHFFSEVIEKFVKKTGLKMKVHKNPMFLTSKEEFKDYLSEVKKPFMSTFYSRQRKRLDLLVNEEGEPEGGRWSFDTENRKKYPKGIEIPKIIENQKSEFFKDVVAVVQEHFETHPGDTDNFWIPTTRKQALTWLNNFVEKKLEKFGPYEDAIKSNDTFGFHSVLSPLINNGLILPEEVVEKIITKGRELDMGLESIEGFVRQVIGWREFVKGIYDNFSSDMDQENFWDHNRKLTASWYSGETGILPLDDSIKKAQTYGYTHHIERLMILSNIMLLSEIDPKEVHRWFMEMYVDSADWVMAANVYGMGQMSEGGIFATKPYICGSNYILKMSDYKKGDWCETMDGLYWRFIDKHKKTFAKNQRMSMMVKMLEKMESSRKKKIFAKAEEFIKKNTQ